jgi:hypothetical protein
MKKTKRYFYIRNHWSRNYDGFYLFGAGWMYQDFYLKVYHLWILGFCLCLFVDTDPRNA